MTRPKSLSHERLRLLITLGLALLAFIVLATGISSVQPRTGEILFAPREERLVEDDGIGPSRLILYRPDTGNPIFMLLTGIAVLLSIYGAYRSPRVRAGLLTIFTFFSLYFVVVYLYRLFYVPPEEDEAALGELLPPQPERLPEDLLQNVPDLVDWVSVAVTIGLVIMALVVTWLVWRWWSHRSKSPLEIVAHEAEAALAGLRAGATLKDAVMRCYYDMGQALRKEMGLVRQEGMTPREFEEVLEKAELPAPSVQQLTRLFEQVRYGGQTADARDTEAAIACLEAIIAATKG